MDMLSPMRIVADGEQWTVHTAMRPERGLEVYIPAEGETRISPEGRESYDEMIGGHAWRHDHAPEIRSSECAACARIGTLISESNLR